MGRRNRLRARRFGVVFTRRFATTSGAITLGLVALMFARNADDAQRVFAWAVSRWPFAPLLVTPAAFALIVYITRTWAPESRGSGIPQVIAGAHNPDAPRQAALTSLRTAGFKYILTLAVLLVGGSAGREGPTVQISAAIMKATHRLLGVDLTSAVIIAGGAAGVSAAFNTPLAGVAFAIEELASAYEQRLAVLVMGAVMMSGLVSLGLAGDYLYFGAMHDVVTLNGALLICPIAGVFGGLCGGVFSRAILAFGATTWRPIAEIRTRPIAWAAACGLLIAVFGVASGGKTWGAGYETARAIIETHGQPLWFGPAKMIVTLLTTLSGAPGGIFAPSLSAGAGLGTVLATWFPTEPAGAVVILGMIGFFVGVIRSPLTAVFIISEMTDSRTMILQLVATAIVADGVSAIVCRERLYHGLAKAFRASAEAAT